jgi:hypothetical protein
MGTVQVTPDSLDGCHPGRWLGTWVRNSVEHRVDVTRDDEAWLLVLFATALGNDQAVRRKAEQWRELFTEEPF